MMLLLVPARNLRTIDGMIMQYEYDHGKGVFPTTIEEAVPAYLKSVPEEPQVGHIPWMQVENTQWADALSTVRLTISITMHICLHQILLDG